MKLVVATGNQGKLKEIRRLIDGSGIEVVGLNAYPDAPEVVEDGDTFEANAIKKAETIAAYTQCMTLADDSGLVVDALDGRPGVYSARYAGETATDADNNRKLLEELSEVSEGDRQAAFCCAMALSIPGQPSQVFHGRVSGMILKEPQGEGGFGYDPLFFVPEQGKTMAQLPMEVKNSISHRGQALCQALEALKKYL